MLRRENASPSEQEPGTVGFFHTKLRLFGNGTGSECSWLTTSLSAIFCARDLGFRSFVFCFFSRSASDMSNTNAQRIKRKTYCGRTNSCTEIETMVETMVEPLFVGIYTGIMRTRVS